MDFWASSLVSEPAIAQQQDSTDYLRQLNDFLAANPVPGSIAAKSFDSLNSFGYPPILQAPVSPPEDKSSPESSSGSGIINTSYGNDSYTIPTRQGSGGSSAAPSPPELLRANSSAEQLTMSTGSKRKTSATSTKKGAAALKDRRASHGARADDIPVSHTHDHDEDEDGDHASGKKNMSASDRRKEQNRNAQRAFRERKEKHLKVLEDQVAVLEQAANKRESENQKLKELVGQLQKENARLATMGPTASSNAAAINSAFTFNLPASTAPAGTALPKAFSASPNAFVLPKQQQQQQPALSAPELDASYLSFINSPAPFLSAKATSASPLTPPGSTSTASSTSGAVEDLFAEPLFTPGGEHINPLNSFGQSFAAPTSSAPSPEAALSPNTSAALFSAYREPVSALSAAPESSNSWLAPAPWAGYNDLDDLFGLSSAASTSSVDVKPVVTSSPPALSPSTSAATCDMLPLWKNVRGSEDFDLDALCRDMTKKATCAEMAKASLSVALEKDWDMKRLFNEMGQDSSFTEAYAK